MAGVSGSAQMRASDSSKASGPIQSHATIDVQAAEWHDALDLSAELDKRLKWAEERGDSPDVAELQSVSRRIREAARAVRGL